MLPSSSKYYELQRRSEKLRDYSFLIRETAKETVQDSKSRIAESRVLRDSIDARRRGGGNGSPPAPLTAFALFKRDAGESLWNSEMTLA